MTGRPRIKILLSFNTTTAVGDGQNASKVIGMVRATARLPPFIPIAM
ncbi:hypothetical protein [Dyadobacter sp. 32]